MVITRNHGVGQVPGVVETNPTDLPELFKPSRDLENLKKTIYSETIFLEKPYIFDDYLQSCVLVPISPL